MMTKHGNEIEVGDVIETGAGLAAVVSLRPYDGPLLDILGAGTQIAEFPRGHRVPAITLSAVSTFNVHNGDTI